MADDKQAVEGAEGQRWDCEKVHRGDYLRGRSGVCSKEFDAAIEFLKDPGTFSCKDCSENKCPIPLA